MAIHSDFNSRYRRSVLIGFFWMLFLGFLACVTLDMGECFRVWEVTSVPYIILLVLVLCRRPKQPTRTDLLLVAWSFPLLYFMLLVVYCSPRSSHSVR